MQECLCRDATAMQAGAAELWVFLDDQCLETELGRAEGGDIPTRTAAEDDQIVFRCHERSSGGR